jgi:hypothetical protein
MRLRITDLRCSGAPSALWKRWIWKAGKQEQIRQSSGFPAFLFSRSSLRPLSSSEPARLRPGCLARRFLSHAGTERVLQTVAHTYDGPQTDDLGPEFRRSDRDHFNEAGVKALGLRFARKITQAFVPPPVPAAQAPRPPAR